MSAKAARPVTVTAMLQAKPEQVMRVISDTRNDPLWCPNVDSAEQLAGDGPAVGSKFRFHQHLDRGSNKRIEFDADVEILELSESHIRWRVEDKFQTRIINIEVAPVENGSRITQTTEATFKRAPGLARWVYPVLAKRTFRDQFRHLGAHLDGLKS